MQEETDDADAGQAGSDSDDQTIPGDKTPTPPASVTDPPAVVPDVAVPKEPKATSPVKAPPIPEPKQVSDPRSLAKAKKL